MYSCIVCILHKDTCTERVGRGGGSSQALSLPAAVGTGAGPCPPRAKLCLACTKVLCEVATALPPFSSPHPTTSTGLPLWTECHFTPTTFLRCCLAPQLSRLCGHGPAPRRGDLFPFPLAPQSKPGPGQEGHYSRAAAHSEAFLCFGFFSPIH